MRQLHVLKTPGTILLTPLFHPHFVPSLLISISVLLHHCPFPHLLIRRRSWRRISHYFERHLACHRHCSRRVSCTRALACRAAGRLIKGAGHSSWVWSVARSPDGMKIASRNPGNTECNNNRRLLTRARAAAQAHSTRHRITLPLRCRAGT